MPAAKKVPKAETNGGQWIFTGVLESKDGTIREETRFSGVWAESFFKDYKRARTVGELLRDRTREVLRKAGL